MSIDKKLAKEIVRKINKKDYLCIERSKFNHGQNAKKLCIQPEKSFILVPSDIDNMVIEGGYAIGSMDARFNLAKDFFVYDTEVQRLIKYGQEEVEIKEIDFLKMANPTILKSVFKPKSIFDLKRKVRDPDEAVAIQFLVKWVVKQDISTEVFYKLSTADTAEKLLKSAMDCLEMGQRNFSENAEAGLIMICALLDKRAERR